jgi:hypothetical protein
VSPPRRRRTAREALAAAMPEYAWQALVIDIARAHGWRVLHVRAAGQEGRWRTPVAADGRGFPDLLMCRHDRLIAAELKQVGRYPTPEQRAWLKALALTGAEVYVWRPSDEAEVWLVLTGNPAPGGRDGDGRR